MTSRLALHMQGKRRMTDRIFGIVLIVSGLAHVFGAVCAYNHWFGMAISR
jgi:hypothetical protein